jgi:glycosyltransferase involved in cell wall biosynthesis
MRILSIGASLGRGGTERAVETFSLGFERLGHAVAVLAWQDGGLRQAHLEEHGVEVFIGGAGLPRALDAAEAFKPDLIHIHRVGVASAVETEMLRRLRTPDRRVIETNVFGRVDTSEARRYIDVHMHLSKWCLWRWHRWLRWRDSSQIGVVVPNPVEPNSFRRVGAEQRRQFRARLGIGEHEFVCGRVGQPNGANWHPILFEAFASLARLTPDARLLLVGLPDNLRRHVKRLPQHVQRLIVELPLTDDDAALADVYSSLDCFVHAARFGESFGYVMTESMLCECPVITASTPHVNNSQVEVVGHLRGGIVSASLDGLPNALCRMYTDRTAWGGVGSMLRDRVASRFGVETVTALAARIGLAALDTDDRSALRRRLADMEDCVSHVTDHEIRDLMNDALGATRVRDRVEMQLRHVPAVQAVIDKRLTRRLDRGAASRIASSGSHTDSGSRAYEPRMASELPTAPAAPVVSAIMCAYNTAPYIGAAIDSLLAQTLPNWELIVVDDGSTDSTPDVLKQYVDPRIRTIRCDRNRGRSIARNLAVEQARGRYIAICDSDDISVPTRFALQAAYLDAHPDVDVVSAQVAHFTGSSTPTVVVRFPLTSARIRERLARRRMGLAHGASMLRVEAFRRYGGYCPDVLLAEDLELFCRMADRCTFASLPDALVAYRHALPDPFRRWLSSTRYQRYARYRLTARATRERRPLAYEEFAKGWKLFVLIYTVDVARFALWSIRSRLAQMGHQ